MKSGIYSKIASDNIKKNPRLYVPRILAEAGLLACFYIAFALATDDRLADLKGGDYVVSFMAIGTAVLGLLSLVLILYINSFLMKRRKSEYGLYNVLGMEKRHIVRVLFSESVFNSASSLALGVGAGMLFYKLFSLLICRLLQTEPIAGFYYINAKTLLIPAAAFALFDLLAFLVNSVSVRKLKPVELLAESHTGEREPKVKWAMLITGVLAMSSGYVISLSVKTAMKALTWFFPAVILVIIGTYFLFVTGTTFVLKCLKKNRNYYYSKRHMPAVAGLLFRMKQNAVGLASIAILATGILVMISTTVSLYTGMQESLDSRYPEDFYISAFCDTDTGTRSISSAELGDIVNKAAAENGLEISSVEAQRYLSVSYLLRDGKLLMRTEVTGGWNLDEITSASFITKSDYDRLMNAKLIANHQNFELAADEIVYCRASIDNNDASEPPASLTIGGREYKVKESFSYFPIGGQMNDAGYSIGIIVSDDSVLEDIYLAQKEGYGEYASEYTDRIAASFTDYEAAEARSDEFGDSVFDNLHEEYGNSVSGTYDTKWDAGANLLGMYGAFLFLGIILGMVCLFSTILIIYYKQISEGYEDRERFQIMQKIGMEEAEVRKTIRSQMILQFFLPLITAGVHTAAAFPMLMKLLSLLMLSDKALAVVCALITYAVFAVVYIAVYLLTSKTYYKIVH